jgi:hypothetical protein
MISFAQALEIVKAFKNPEFEAKIHRDARGRFARKDGAATAKVTTVAGKLAEVPIAKPRPKSRPIAPMAPASVLESAPKRVDGTGSRKIDKAGEAALERYRGSDFTEINGHLRGQSDGKGPKWMGPLVDRIDAVHEQSRLTQEVTVYRGVGSVSAVFGPDAAKNLTGAEWIDDAFQSTTADASTAETFMINSVGRREAAVIRIRVPAGVGAIQLSDERYESELLLQRGLPMRVVSDTGPPRRGQKAPRTIEVEVLV